MDSAFPDSWRHSHKSWLMRLSIWYLVEIFGSLLCSSLFISFTFSYLAISLLCLRFAWKYRIGSFKGSEVTRNQCLGQSWLHALRQSRLLLEDSPPVTQFSVTGREAFCFLLCPKGLLLDLLGDGFRILPSYSRCLRFLREGGPRIPWSFLDDVA